MKRFLKIFRVFLLLVTLLVIAGLVFWIFFLPGIVENEVRQLLTDMGFSSVDLEVRGLSLHHAAIAGISIGKDRGLTIGNVDVDFDIEGLGAVRIRKVRVTGAVLKVRYEDGEIDLGPLHDIDTGDSDGDGELPFDRVDISASTILVTRGGTTDHIPVDGSLIHIRGGTLSANLRTIIFGRDLRISGDVSSVAQRVQAVVVTGAGYAHVNYDWSGPRTGLWIELQAREGDVEVIAGDQRVRAGSVAAFGSFTLEALEDITDSNLEIEARGLSVAGVDLGTATLKAETREGLLHLAVQGTRRTGSKRSTILSASTSASASVAALLDPEAARRFRLRLDGDVPEEAVSLIRGAGLEPGVPFTVKAGGEGVFQWRSGDFEAALTLSDLELRAGAEQHPRFLVETILPGQVAYDASGSFRLRLPGLRTTLPAPALLESGLLATTGLHLEAKDGRVEASFECETVSPLTLAGGDIEARSVSLRIEGKAVAEAGELVALNSRIEVKADRLLAPAAGLSVSEVEAEIPILHGLVESTGGTFGTGEITWKGHRFPGVEGDVLARPGSVNLDAKWPVVGEGAVVLTGDVRLSAGRPDGVLSFTGKRIPVAKDDNMGRFIRDLTGLAFAGRLNLEGSFPLGTGGNDPTVNVTLNDGTISDPGGSLSLEGVNLSVTVDTFSPIRTPGGQTLRFESGKLGEYRLGNGQVAFRVDGPKQVSIEDARWEFGRTASRLGRFWARPFQFNPADLAIDTTLFCEGFNLADWLSLVAPEGTMGRGMLYGRVPFKVKMKPRLSATLGEGYLFAEGGGWIRVRGTEEYVKLHLPAVGPTAEYTEVVQRRIVHALENFDFEKLRFDLVEKDDGLTLRVGVMGHGAEVLEGTVGKQELDLTLNFNGVDSLIGPALDASLGIKELSKLLEGAWKGGPK